MTSTSNYQPPSATRIAELQDEDAALRLLIAQRRIYSRAKRWLGARWIGLVILGVGAPIVSLLYPHLTAAAGAIAGVWIFLGRTLFASREQALAAQAAAVQEQFDFRVFEMPDLTPRRVLPSPEEIALAAGDQATLRQRAAKAKLTGWYTIPPSAGGGNAVAIAQRSNAAYTDRLLRLTGTVWLVLVIVWVIFLVVVACVSDLSFRNVLLGVMLPVLPGALDVTEFLRAVWRSAQDRAELADTIQQRLESSQPIDPGELLSWQERLFELRRTSPLVPDVIYWRSRRRNERAMIAAAESLGATVPPTEADNPGTN